MSELERIVKAKFLLELAIDKAISVVESDEYGDCHDKVLRILKGAIK